MKRKTLRLIALSLCVVLMAAAVVDTAPVSAYAVTQTEIDALKAERDAIKAQRQEKQAIVEQLEADKASVVEQKQAMDERNMYTLQQIQLNSDEIALYDEMIADKEKELTEAQRLEDEQLERYRARVRAMEENGSVGYLAMVLKTSSLGDFLTAMDDIGEIMHSLMYPLSPIITILVSFSNISLNPSLSSVEAGVISKLVIYPSNVIIACTLYPK